MGQKISAAQIEDAIDILLAGKIKTVAGNVIVGTPGETASMVRKNPDQAVALIHKHPGQVEISASVLTSNPGAPFCKDPKRSKRKYSVTFRLGAMDLHSPSCSTHRLTRDKIAFLYEEFLQAIAPALDETLPATSPELRREHWRFQELGLDTPYARKLAAHHYVAKFYQYVYLEGLHREVMDIPVHELPHAIPHRTHMAVQLGFDGNVVLTGLSPQIVALNTTASFLDEMACGQHTVTEIAQRLYQRLPAHRRPPLRYCVTRCHRLLCQSRPGYAYRLCDSLTPRLSPTPGTRLRKTITHIPTPFQCGRQLQGLAASQWCKEDN